MAYGPWFIAMDPSTSSTPDSSKGSFAHTSRHTDGEPWELGSALEALLPAQHRICMRANRTEREAHNETSTQTICALDTGEILLPSASPPRRESTPSNEPPSGWFSTHPSDPSASWLPMGPVCVTALSPNVHPTTAQGSLRAVRGHARMVIFNATYAGLKMAKPSPGGAIWETWR